MAFWALGEIVRQRLGIAEEDLAEAASEKLTAGLDRFVSDPDERAYIGMRLGRLLGVAAAGDSGAALSREELFAGWRLFFERLAATGPVVLLVEDAQHADGGLLDFLDHLVDWARDLPVYVLVFARPELDEVRAGFGTGRNRVTLTLDPLDPASMEQLMDALVPGMPSSARSKITGQAQGIPLFAVETVRSLIDRDVVQPVEGVYRLVGYIGELVVPDSLHALLAARLDALDPGVRRLVADAAVLGTTFSAEALVAMSGQDEFDVRAALADLVRREVLSVSADPLSPERGSYRFAQQMLRQVAYDTLSRRDRKARHLKVAAHLRAAFPGGGEEVADVIARHYLDALSAVPDDPDVTEIRGQAIAALIRAAERAERTGAPARAAASYATAAELTAIASQGEAKTADGLPEVGTQWERAAEAAIADADYVVAVEYAGHARQWYLEQGQDRDAARAQAATGRALLESGRSAEARDQLIAAAEVLRADPDADTVRALYELATLEALVGSPDADRLTLEALSLGQALDVDVGQICDLFNARAIHLAFSGRQPEAVAYLREGARLATQAGDNFRLGRALLNLAVALNRTDPAAGAEAARTAAGHLRRAGARDYLATAIMNLAGSLRELGDWDTAEEELSNAMDSDGLTDMESLVCERGLLAAQRGDAVTAETALAGLHETRASEAAQVRTTLSLIEAFTAAARCQPKDALRYAHAALSYAPIVGMGHGDTVWAWTLAARAAHELGDVAAVRELLALLDSYQPGHLAPLLRAERELVRARLASLDGDKAAASAFATAISSLRARSTPYHLAHGLLDHAEHLVRLGGADGAAAAVDEARVIAVRLRCQPLLDRAGALDRAEPRIQAELAAEA